ncbi:efflux RND transporter periplasmic adaptor subunit [Plasticicumulans acidivorans]|uniref:HlyD family secretion protein n=1 Tax=Plasticicumulans acidivorans TaxID=886464 RepID=A0A317MYB3_9GAMM|nr:efflux RND transporter periplasmic adaptor subunit [Plasticicumulans acidivorans]PWV63504.1 HlyD family secretion protein [Plasticicumulans acidivorans]
MTSRPEEAAADLAALLGSEAAVHTSIWRRWWWWLLLLALAALLFLWLGGGGPAHAVQYRTEALGRGDLRVAVTATGTLQPTNEVTIGVELSGTMATVLVDYNDPVKEGQILAQLDTTKLKAQMLSSRATLEANKAKVLQTQATVKEATAELARLREVARLSGGKVPSRTELDSAEATLARARADQSSAEAAVKQAAAQLEVDDTNLNKAVIRSPINGVVLERDVDPGQTVAASLQAPTLFTLAEDLRRMELHVDVAEADVGQVTAGQQATFTVDAWPEMNFPAQITQVRYGSKTVDNVVSYETVLSVANDDLRLRPGMTATAEITVAERKSVLRVSNAALRFSPPLQNAAPKRSLVASLLPHPPAPPARPKAQSGDKHIWLLRDGQPVAVAVSVGASDGRYTEVSGDGLAEGAAVIVDSVSVSQ